MQAQTPEVSGEKATTPADELRLVSVEQLNKIHRELDACQKAIWLAGCGQRGYGFDPAYVTGAQEQLKQIEALLAAAPAQEQQVETTARCFCGGPYSKNPHEDAGKPTRVLEVGAVYECIPCLTKSRHEWSKRATAAESELSALKAQQEPVAWRVTGAGGLTVTPEYPKWAEDDSRLLIESLYTAPQPAPAQDVAELPPLGESLRSILGRPNFACAGIAKHLRGMGYAIPQKAEEEQAATIHWLVNLYLKHGDGWATHANAALAAQDKQSGGAQ